jgi:glutaconyl-CoA/methylmalonyl-CoA decarboxylase subunit gamma
MPAFSISISGKVYQVEIPDPGASPLQVIVDGQSFQVGIVGTEVVATPAKLAPPPPPAAQPTPLPPPPSVEVRRPPVAADLNSGNAVVAPMPGTILSIEVKKGQQVEVGQVLCVLEAMKMKNPIRATHPGTIAEVCVEPGRTVPFGEVLIRLA